MKSVVIQKVKKLKQLQHYYCWPVAAAVEVAGAATVGGSSE